MDAIGKSRRGRETISEGKEDWNRVLMADMVADSRLRGGLDEATRSSRSLAWCVCIGEPDLELTHRDHITGAKLSHPPAYGLCSSREYIHPCEKAPVTIRLPLLVPRRKARVGCMSDGGKQPGNRGDRSQSANG